MNNYCNTTPLKPGTKLPAFTILEMLFVLLLTSIVISLAFAYYNTFQTYLHNQNNVISYEMDVMRFESIMYYDIDRAKSLNFRYGILYSNGTNVKYKFNDRNVIRFQNEVTDTLKGTRLIYTIKYSEEGDNEITGLELEFTDYNKRKRMYTFTKHNDEKTKLEAFKKRRIN